MKRVPSKPKKAATKLPENPVLAQELPARLAELETELRRYPTLDADDRPLKSVEKPTVGQIGQEKVIQFALGDKFFAAGRTDVTYASTNHARGVRHIRFYEDGKVVLDIEGDYEDQEFGSNFRFQNVDLHVPGEWEKDFLKLTDEFRHYKMKRRNAMYKKRAAEHNRAHR
jgi:hypothetical protein